MQANAFIAPATARRVEPRIAYTPFTDAERALPTVRRFEAQAARFADKIAISDSEAALTYRALDSATNQLAHAILARLADSPTTAPPIIGMCITHGVRSVVGIWGILKAGKAFFVIDPKLPAARMREMLLDAAPPVIIVDAAHEALIADFDLPNVMILPLFEATEAPIIPPDVPLSLDDPMSVYYTSGSTGKPKGVIRGHRTRISSTNFRTNLYHMNHTDRQFYAGTFGFSASLNTILVTLLNGASLHLFDLEREGLGAITERIDSEQITIFSSTPTLYRAWTALVPPGKRFASLRLIALGGESVRSDDFDTFKRITPDDAVFCSTLASSEGGVIAAYLAAHDTPVEPGVFPIGYPAEERQIALVDEHGQPTPPGEVGEIVVQDSLTASGYLNRPEQSAAKFKHDADGNPLYFTGDLARLRADGVLLHMGRKDTQIKINGQRIELGEIETVLVSHPALAQAVVLPIDDARGDKSLVAYCVPHDENHPPTDAAVRAFLRARLPAIMIPTHLVFIGTLPLNVNGKVDLQKLINPTATIDPTARATTVAAPSDDIERALVGMWEAALKIAPIGVDEDFFALGGHSLLAAFVFAQIEARFGRVIPLTAMLQQPTIQQIAALIRDHVDMPWTPLVPLTATGTRPPLFCIPGIEGFVMVFKPLAAQLGADQPVYGLQAQGVDSRREPLTRIEDMAAAYIAALRTVQPSGALHLIGYSGGGYIALDVARQWRAAGESVAFLGIIDTAFNQLPDGTHLEKARTQHPTGRAARLWLTAQQHAHNLATMPNYYRPRYIAHVANALVFRLRNGTPVSMSAAIVPQQIERVRNATQAALRAYQPTPYAGRVDYFRALHGRFDPRMFRGLATLTTGNYHLHEVPGNHGTMLRDPNVSTLAAALRAAQAAAALPPVRSR